MVVATDLLALTVLQAPGQWGADVCVGSAQRFGVPMGFGGPHAGFLAVANEKHLRVMPGRVIGACSNPPLRHGIVPVAAGTGSDGVVHACRVATGMSKDSNGRPALRMALQTREQHIRRDKATPNICTAQALLANMAASYAVYHGPDGLREIGGRVHRVAQTFAQGVQDAGHSLVSDTFFDTVSVKLGGGATADTVISAAYDAGINLRRVDDSTVGVAFDETATKADVAAVLRCFGASDDVDALAAATAGSTALGLPRDTPYLTNSVFNTYHSETNMLRYLHKLQSRDLSLTYGMIPLGSCTMKVWRALAFLVLTRTSHNYVWCCACMLVYLCS